ncbi:MAG: D-alanyl-D-alanine carboxypeptidase family protein [Oscillospiraceae bacterium]
MKKLIAWFLTAAAVALPSNYDTVYTPQPGGGESPPTQYAFTSIEAVAASAPVKVPSVSAKGAILIDAASGRVVFDQNAGERLPMASTTKIMTTLLCLESGGLEDYFTVDSNAIKVEGSSMGLQAGDRVTKRILCYGMMLPSGNDAANATAVRVGGSIESFVSMMNEKAQTLGLTDTHFVTPSGLDDYTDAHYSTARDMAMLTRTAMQNDEFRKICAASSACLNFGNPPYERWLTNSNRLLRNCQGVIGVKTGFTDKARRCLVSACERNGTTLICVTLNDPNDWLDHANLYDYGFSLVKHVSLESDYGLFEVPVAGGAQDTAKAKLAFEPSASLFDGEADLVKQQVILPKFVYAPVVDGEALGSVDYYVNDMRICSVPIVAQGEIPAAPPEKMNIFEFYYKAFKELFS